MKRVRISATDAILFAVLDMPAAVKSFVSVQILTSENEQVSATDVVCFSADLNQ